MKNKIIYLSFLPILIGLCACKTPSPSTSVSASGEIVENNSQEFNPFDSTSTWEPSLPPSSESIIVSESFPSEMVGRWVGVDDNETVFFFTIQNDGTATLENEIGKTCYHFGPAVIENSSYSVNYIFTCLDGKDEIVTIYYSKNVVNFGINTDIMEGVINDYFNYYFSSVSNYPVQKI